jgi:hypothetical protein
MTVPSNLPNKTPISQILNAAVAGWAGFIYQGLCGLCVALEQLLEDRDEASKRFLNLEGYEDFAILDENKHILSLHQCKNFKDPRKNFEEEFKKMEDKRVYWNRKGICDADVPLYFHAPLIYKYTHGVKAYNYKDRNNTASSDEIDDKIKVVISDYLNKYHVPANTSHKHDKLIQLISRLVTKLDNEGKKKNLKQGEMLKISVDNALQMVAIKDILEDTDDEYSLQDIIRNSVYYINLWMNERMESDPDHPKDKIHNFLYALDTLDADMQEKFVRRIFPDVDIDKGTNVLTEISNSQRSDYLYNVVKGTIDLDRDDLNWFKNGHLVSPSALGNSRSPKELCGKIAINKHLPQELLRDYDYIVGDIQDSVEDIFKAAQLIGRINEVDYNNITKIRKVGLLSIDDFNNG